MKIMYCIKWFMGHPFCRFVLVGIVNTVVGYGVFYALFVYCDVQPYAANAIGYLVALSIAFFLSKNFVFAKKYKPKMLLKYTISFIFCFCINQLVLFVLVNAKYMIPELAQIVAMLTYTLAFYFANKYFVFGR